LDNKLPRIEKRNIGNTIPIQKQKTQSNIINIRLKVKLQHQNIGKVITKGVSCILQTNPKVMVSKQILAYVGYFALKKVYHALVEE